MPWRTNLGGFAASDLACWMRSLGIGHAHCLLLLGLRVTENAPLILVIPSQKITKVMTEPRNVNVENGNEAAIPPIAAAFLVNFDHRKG